MASEPTKPNVAKAGFIMVASLFLSRVLGLIRDMVITGKFGLDGQTDAYYASFQIPDLLFYLIAGGALSSAFIPVFTEYLHTDREDEAWHIFSVVVTVMSAIVVTFIVFAWIYAEPLMGIVAPDLAPEAVADAVKMSRIIVPAQFAFFIGGVMLGTLYARQVFAVPGLAPNIYNIGIIIGAVFISSFVVPSLAGMSWGALIGAYIGNILIPLMVIRKMGLKFKFSFDTKHPGVRQVFKLMLPVVLGLSLPGVFGMILVAAGSYYGDGILSSIVIGNRLMQAPLGVFGQALALAAFPALSQFFAQGRMDMFTDQVNRTLRTVIFLTVPVSVIFVVAPEPIVTALFKRGDFDMTDVQNTSTALRMFGIGIAAWCLHPTLMRAYFSIKRTWPPVVMGTVTTGVFAASTFWLVNAGYGYSSLPLAASIAAILLAIAMVTAVNKTVCELDIKGILLTFAKSAVASALPAVGLYFLATQYSSTSSSLANFDLLLAVGFVMLLYAWAYYFLAKWMKMPEAQVVKRGLDKSK